MENILRSINSRVFKTTDINIDSEIRKCNNKIKKAVQELQDMDYLYIDNNEFELDVFLNNLLELHPLCAETLFSSRTGKLVITETVIAYTLYMAKKEESEEDYKDLVKSLGLLMTVLDNIKSIETLNVMKTRKTFSPKLLFDGITNAVISRETIDFESHIVQKLFVLKDVKVNKLSFNEIYLRVLCEKLGIPEEDIEKARKNNEGLLSDMSYKEEVQFLPLLIDEHIYNDKVSELSYAIFNNSYGLNTLLGKEILKEGRNRISSFMKETGIEAKANEILSIGTYELIMMA